MSRTISTIDSADLHVGMAKIAFKSYVAIDDYSLLDFSEDNLLFSLKDSFDLASNDASSTDITTDQGQTLDSVITDPGSSEISFDLPSMHTTYLAQFFSTATVTSPANTGKMADGTAIASATSFFNTPKESELTIEVESQSGKTDIVWGRVKFTAVLAKGDNSVMVIRLKGKVLANGGTAGDVSIRKASSL